MRCELAMLGRSSEDLGGEMCGVLVLVGLGCMMRYATNATLRQRNIEAPNSPAQVATSRQGSWTWSLKASSIPRTPHHST